MKTDPSEPVESTGGRKPIWVFTPSRTDPKDLEFILVQRQELLKDAVERVRESALTEHKHHLLFVGPRGCGKTHLVTLVVSRLGEDEEVADRLRIAWLNEDETCTTLLELLLKIHAALEKRYPDEYRADMLDAAFERKQDAALDFVATHLLASLGPRTLLVVAENLDAIFEGLGDSGQKQVRAFIQENPKLAIVATAQRLVEDLSNRAGPFFGFFQTEHLKPLNVKEATELLQNIARLHGQSEVVEFLATSRGHSRVRALHHLSGGNHRIYIVLSQFITRDSIDALVGPFLKMVDELTPYYQERIRWLPTQQRKIVEFLCSCEGTVPVKAIAKRLFATPQTVSGQLQELREKGYVEANQRGRESLYEISEPMMRICVEVKDNQRHEPLRLVVSFLRVWYDDHDLKCRLDRVEPRSESCAYLESAIQKNCAEGNLRKQIFLQELQSTLPNTLRPADWFGFVREVETLPEMAALSIRHLNDGMLVEAANCLVETISEENDPIAKANLLLFRARLPLSPSEHQSKVSDYTAVVELAGAEVRQMAEALVNRGTIYGQIGETQCAIDDFTRVIGFTAAPVRQRAIALFNRGVTYGKIGEAQREIEDYTAVIGLADVPVEQLAMALANRGTCYDQMEEPQRAIEDYTSVIALSGASASQLAIVYFNRGVTYGRMGELKREIEDYTAVIGLADVPVEHLAMALINRGACYDQMEEPQHAIEDYTIVIGLADVPVERLAMALVNRGVSHGRTGQDQREIEDYTAAIELSGAPVEQLTKAHMYRGVTYGLRGATQKEVDDYTAVIELADVPTEQVAKALFNRGVSRGKQGEEQRAIEDYTAVIELVDAPVKLVSSALINRGASLGRMGEMRRAIQDYTAAIEIAGGTTQQVAKALVNRGITYGRMGEPLRAIEDFTIAIESADFPVEQITRALLNRAARYGHIGEMQAAIKDYTAVIEFGDAPLKDVASALFNRGVVCFQQGRNQEAESDFKSLIHLEDAPVESLIDAYMALAELCASEGRWKAATDFLLASLHSTANSEPKHYGCAVDLIGVLFSAGLSPGGRRDRISELAQVYSKHQALTVLSEAVVQHMGEIFRSDQQFPSADNLDGWVSVWEEVAEDVGELSFVVRLLRTGVAFIKSNGEDLGVLLDLTSTDRAVLEQAFGIGGDQNGK